MSIILFTATPGEIALQILEYFRKSSGDSTMTSSDVCLRYQQNVLRQMNIGIIKSLITKSVKLIVNQHSCIRFVMSHDYSGDVTEVKEAGKFRKVYSLAVSHYPDLIGQLEMDSIARFCTDPRYDTTDRPVGALPCDIAGRYYLFLLAR